MRAAASPPLTPEEEAKVQSVRIGQLVSSAALLRRHGAHDWADALCHDAGRAALKVLALGGKL